jgi:hypothetical protein
MVEEEVTKCKIGTIFIQKAGERWMDEQREVNTGCTEMGM